MYNIGMLYNIEIQHVNGIRSYYLYIVHDWHVSTLTAPLQPVVYSCTKNIECVESIGYSNYI